MDTGSFIRRLALILGISVGALVLGLNSGHYKLPSQDILKGSRQDIALAMGVLPGIGMPAAVKGGVTPVTYVAAASNTAGGSGSIIVSTPTGAQSGDLLVFLGVQEATSSWDNPPSSGWTVKQNNSGSGNNLMTATRSHDGTTSNWTFTSGAFTAYKIAAIVACRGGVFDAAGTFATAGSPGGQTNLSIPSVTLAKSGSILFAFAGGTDNTASALPTGFTGTVVQSDAQTGGSMDCYYKTNVGAGATGAVTLPSSTAGSFSGILIGIKPA